MRFMFNFSKYTSVLNESYPHVLDQKLSNSNKLINFEIKKFDFWDEIREEVKKKWFGCVRNKNMKM